MKNNHKDDVKEEFCGTCLALPLALAGAGAAGVSSSDNNDKTKKILFWGGISITIVSIIATIIFLRRCKTCK